MTISNVTLMKIILSPAKIEDYTSADGKYDWEGIIKEYEKAHPSKKDEPID